MGVRGTGKFSHLPRWDHGCIYVAEISNGLVKVGMTLQPYSRMHNLNQSCRTKYDAAISRCHIGPHIGLKRTKLLRAEDRLIGKVRWLGSRIVGTREYFTGVPFDVVVALVDKISGQFQPRKRAAMTAGAVAPQPQTTEASTATTS